jgi:hypothetical protein
VAGFEPSGFDDINRRAEWAGCSCAQTPQSCHRRLALYRLTLLSSLLGAMMSGVSKDFAHREDGGATPRVEGRPARRVGVVGERAAEQCVRDLAHVAHGCQPAANRTVADAHNARGKVYPL